MPICITVVNLSVHSSGFITYRCTPLWTPHRCVWSGAWVSEGTGARWCRTAPATTPSACLRKQTQRKTHCIHRSTENSWMCLNMYFIRIYDKTSRCVMSDNSVAFQPFLYTKTTTTYSKWRFSFFSYQKEIILHYTLNDTHEETTHKIHGIMVIGATAS